jgi:hypothetical protein
VLKLCSFKVAAHSNGYRFGELLLKTVFDYGVTNRYDWVFAAVFEKYTSIIELFEQFGFSHLRQRTHLGELVLAKPLTPEAEPRRQLTPLAYHVRYGPHYFWPSGVPWYVLPIQPRFASTLFPESASQATLFPGRHPSGNALRKAYLCHSPTRSIQPGAVLAFYRSRSERGIVVIGVVENTLVWTSSIEIARTVGKRTVYSLREIERLCRQPVLVILFRQSRVLRPGISFKELIEAKVLSRGPQSITMLDLEAVEWLQQRIAE